MELKICHSKHINWAMTNYWPREDILSQNKSYEGFEWTVLLVLRILGCTGGWWIIGQNNHLSYGWTSPRPEIAGRCWGIKMFFHEISTPATYTGRWYLMLRSQSVKLGIILVLLDWEFSAVTSCQMLPRCCLDWLIQMQRCQTPHSPT